MMKFFPKSIREHGFYSSPSDGVVSLFIVLVFGMGFGCMASSMFFYDKLLTIGCGGRLLLEAFFFFTLLLSATSWLGIALISAAAFLRGFVLAAFASSAADFSGLGFWALFSFMAVPAMITLPSFFLVAEDCMKISASLYELRFGRGRGYGKPRLLFHLVLSIFCLFFYYVYCAYII